MQIDAILVEKEKIVQTISLKYRRLIESTDSVKVHVNDSVKKWANEVRRRFDTEFPFADTEAGLHLLKNWSEQSDIESTAYSEAVTRYSDFCASAKIPCNRKFWEGEASDHAQKRQKSGKRSQDNLRISTKLLVSEWQKSIDKVRSEWEMAQLAQLRLDLEKTLEKFLKSLEQIKESFDALGLDTGIWVDLSKGNFSDSDIQQFQRWASYLAEDKGVRTLCDLLGKIRAMEFSDRLERCRVSHESMIQLPDINSSEEIVGVRLGRDLEHALPSELALLSDPDTALLFDLKYVESRLMSFDMQGMQTVHVQSEVEENRQVQDTSKQGPMIICVDTSGSMNGMPETIAKAVTLYMASRAKEQGRRCYMINFSTGIETLELSADQSISTLLTFLRKSFHGGTDVAPAMNHALKVMLEENYEKSDLLIISDFIMAQLPNSVLERIEVQRVNGNKFYSLVVDSCYMEQRLKAVFDHEWIFNPKTSSIHELISFQRRITSAE